MNDILKWSLIVAVAILALRFIIAFASKATSGKPITRVMVATFIFTAISAGLATYLVGSINSTIAEQELLGDREKAISDRLSLIREAEIVYQEVNGSYTSNWDSLINFIKNGEYAIIQRTEEIFTLSYGKDSVVVHIDTLDMVPAFDRIFIANYVENAIDSGDFVKFYVKKGEPALKGTKAYSFINSNGAEVSRDFANNGTVGSIEKIALGDKITKGELLLSYSEYRFDPETNLDDLPFVPGYDRAENKQFDIYTAKIATGAAGLLVDVIEVKNLFPFDKSRKESNEIKNRKPLRFGSRTDATTAGNWE